MTAKLVSLTNSLPGLPKLDPAMIEMMKAELAVLEAAQRRDQLKARQAQLAADRDHAPQDSGMDMFMGLILASVLMGGLFPDLGLSTGMEQNLEGMTHLGLMEMSEGDTHAQPTSFERLAGLNKQVSTMAGLSGLAPKNGQMNMMNLVLVMALLKMLNGQQEDRRGRGGNGTMVPDVLGRNHRIAELKRNMDGVCCNKMVFKRQMSAMVKSMNQPQNLRCVA